MKTSCPINNCGAIKVTCPLLSFRGSHLSLECLILMEDCDGLAFGRLALLSSSTQIPKDQAKLLLCFCCVIFSRREGFFEGLAVRVILQRRRMQAFLENKSEREDIRLSNEYFIVKHGRVKFIAETRLLGWKNQT